MGSRRLKTLRVLLAFAAALSAGVVSCRQAEPAAARAGAEGRDDEDAVAVVQIVAAPANVPPEALPPLGEGEAFVMAGDGWRVVVAGGAGFLELADGGRVTIPQVAQERAQAAARHAAGAAARTSPRESPAMLDLFARVDEAVLHGVAAGGVVSAAADELNRRRAAGADATAVRAVAAQLLSPPPPNGRLARAAVFGGRVVRITPTAAGRAALEAAMRE